MGVTVADARFMKPLDVDLIRRLASEHNVMLTVEENAIGGFGSHVLQFMVLDGLMDKVRLVPRLTHAGAFPEISLQGPEEVCGDTWDIGPLHLTTVS